MTAKEAQSFHDRLEAALAATGEKTDTPLADKVRSEALNAGRWCTESGRAVLIELAAKRLRGVVI